MATTVYSVCLGKNSLAGAGQLLFLGKAIWDFDIQITVVAVKGTEGGEAECAAVGIFPPRFAGGRGLPEPEAGPPQGRPVCPVCPSWAVRGAPVQDPSHGLEWEGGPTKLTPLLPPF